MCGDYRIDNFSCKTPNYFTAKAKHGIINPGVGL